MPSIKQLALRGTFWTVASYGISQILRFGSNLILTRLLFPEIFGLMSLAYVFITGLQLFSDLGIHTSLIQNKRGDEPDFLDTAWTLQIIRSVGLWLCCVIIAIPAANFYKEPELAWVLPIVGLGTLIGGFHSTGLASLTRRLAVKQVLIFELGGQIIGLSVMVIWAWFDRSIRALLVGTVVAALVQLVWSHILSPNPPNRLVLEKKAVGEIFSFGKWIFLSTVLTFFAMQSDRLILGKLLGVQLLGVYGIALTLAEIPKQVTLAVGGKIVFPMFSKFVSLPRSEFRDKIRRGRLPILLVTAPVLAMLFSFGDILITTLYDNRYADAAWMISLLALGIWPLILTTTLEGALFAMGNPTPSTWGNFCSFLALASGMWVGFQLFGVVGAVAAVPLSNVPFYAAVSYGLYREKLDCFDQDAYATALLLILCFIFVAARHVYGLPMPLWSV
ncbi:MAG: oligosaccharide flippase family protein [Timaviella obliquedivisa GSE-PSE-MK23-08B]|jgi:O-antigen/teichoic acid export membrane protein|nr:oligosaccharide flippase family protein [Timaviella obliquedivisa GSE-PSE-MK23-08B]